MVNVIQQQQVRGNRKYMLLMCRILFNTESWALAEVHACLLINHDLHAKKSLYVKFNRQYHS